MLFSEIMTKIPQPHRAGLWKEYQTLCNALVLRIREKKQGVAPSETDLLPLRTAARRANEILQEQGYDPFFDPDAPDFLPSLLAELDAIAAEKQTETD
ncbi:MAG: hypothetical protein IIW31_04005 [Clostridia bacterium]|nr:hypothetical protein [Clostridia bacterium]